jgi:crotonobetainyl-CoA:carnitine CoA-transferase CaiB-like acyl-CoA transferase
LAHRFQEVKVNGGTLSGLRVIECSQGVAGPYCCKLLAEYGADVIKVEPPLVGDITRRQGPFPADVPDIERSGLFLHLNTTKKSATLDLATAQGREGLLRLLAQADILVESFAPGQMNSWGLGYDDLKESFPTLVYVSVTPYGQTGPYRDYKGSSLTALAFGGLMSITGDPDREPLSTGGEPAEYFGGIQAWVGTLAALAFRDKYDVGQHVDVSIMESVATADEATTAAYAFMGVVRRRFYSRHFWGYPQDPFPCEEGYVFVHPGPRGFPAPSVYEGASGMALLVGDLELDNNPLFLDRWERWFRWREFDALLEPFLSSATKEEIVPFAQALRMPFAPVVNIAELWDDPHLSERGYFRELEHPSAGALKHTGEIFRMSDSTWRLERAPLLGEHNSLLEQKTVLEQGRSVRKEPGAGPKASPVAALPLTGVRVLDLSQVWAGPSCTSILASLGADVIKVEGLVRGDVSHTILYRDEDVDEDPWSVGPYYFSHNAGKRGIALNLLDERGIALFKRLLAACDVLIESFSPRVMRNFGLDYETLVTNRRDLIMVSMSGYGQTGPYSDYTAYGMGLEATAGFTSITGYSDGPPMRTSVSFSDPLSGAVAAGAIFLALRHREQVGRGQYIDISQHEAAIPLLGAVLMEYQMTGRIRERMGNRSTVAAPQGCYPCREDDDWLVVSIDDEREWESFCAAVGHSEWLLDARFSDLDARRENHDALDNLIANWTSKQDGTEAFHFLQKAGVKAAPVLDGKQMLLDPHLRERRHFDILDHGKLGPRPIPRRLIAKFDRMDPRPLWAAPALGAHNAEVLRELAGVSEEELADLEAAGVIGNRHVQQMPEEEMRAKLSFPLQQLVEQGSLRAVEPDYLEQLGLVGRC